MTMGLFILSRLIGAPCSLSAFCLARNYLPLSGTFWAITRQDPMTNCNEYDDINVDDRVTVQWCLLEKQ